MASIFQRGRKGTWWIKYYVNGQQVYRSLKTTHERVARQAKRRVEAEQVTGDLLAPSKIPLPEFLEAFCRFLATVRSHKSYKNDLSVLRIFFGPVCPAMIHGSCANHRHGGRGPSVRDYLEHRHVAARYLEEVTSGMIENFISQRVQEDGIAPKTANRSREVLHRMFNYATKNWRFVSPDRRYPNPAAAVERRREPAPNIRFLDMQQIVELLKMSTSHDTLHAAVATLIFAGLRREELTWLTCDDVDLNRRLIHVRSKTVSGKFWQPKTRRNRVVPISGRLCEILNCYHPARLPDQPWFFPSPRGYRWDPDNFSQDIAKYGLSWTCLDFRHTFGSQLAQKGVSLYKIAEMMGNSPEICRRHYAALMPEKMHAEVEFDETPPRTPGGNGHQAVPPVAVVPAKDNEIPRLRLVQ